MKTATIPFSIEGSAHTRPTSTATAYVDGTASKGFRDGSDSELSHWRPNRTPHLYRATTSTAICFKFLEDPQHIPYDLVVNNHMDLDGLLSVFTLAYPDRALRHKDTLCNAAAMGDFWAWGEGKAFTLFQELTLFMDELERSTIDPQDAHTLCFTRILNILESAATHHPDHTILMEQAARVDQGIIQRHEHTPRL